MRKTKLSEIMDFNPLRKISKGESTKFVEMAALPQQSRNIDEFTKRKFNGGGSKFKNGDVLFARITPCLENGKTAKVSGLNKNEVAHGSTEFIVMSAKDPAHDENFIYYLARHPEFRSFAKGRMIGTSGRQRVSWQSLAEFEFNLPDKTQRKNIGDFLSLLDDKIELNRQTNQTLEQIAQAIFKSWFIDFDPVHAKAKGQKPVGMDDETAALFPDSFEESELGLVPRGWEIKKLRELISLIQRGIQPVYCEQNGHTVRIIMKVNNDYYDDEQFLAHR